MLSVFTIMLTNKLLVLLHIHPLKIYSTHLEKKYTKCEDNSIQLYLKIV